MDYLQTTTGADKRRKKTGFTEDGKRKFGGVLQAVENFRSELMVGFSEDVINMEITVLTEMQNRLKARNNAVYLTSLSLNFIFITIINFFLGLVLFSLVVVMTNYSLSVYDVSTGVAALTASIYLLGSLFGRLYTAKISQKYNAKKLLMI
ncbi:hypothetical protein ABEQ41_30405 [Priestia megaterium]